MNRKRVQGKKFGVLGSCTLHTYLLMYVPAFFKEMTKSVGLHICALNKRKCFPILQTTVFL